MHVKSMVVTDGPIEETVLVEFVDVYTCLKSCGWHGVDLTSADIIDGIARRAATPQVLPDLEQHG